MKYGANTFIWASPFSTAAHLGLLDHVARLGFDVIEVAFEDPALIDLDALAGRAADVGLDVLVCGAYGPGRNLVSAAPAERAATAAYVRTLIDAADQHAQANVGRPPGQRVEVNERRVFKGDLDHVEAQPGHAVEQRQVRGSAEGRGPDKCVRAKLHVFLA